MNWEHLLTLKRFGDTEKRLRKDQNETRLVFEVDFDRIVFSSAFRSLQDKTQVIPLSKTGFVHTRLTHSMEVSMVGRSLGRTVGGQLLKKYPELHTELGYQANDFGAIVAAAALAHDIGNPPFGHSGEKAIGEFFEHQKGAEIKQYICEKSYKDLCSFEGNANGFRILTETRPGLEGGLRLCYPTLGAFTKYPKESLPEKPTKHIADKKYGFFQSEKAFFAEIAHEMQLKSTANQPNELRFARHPLAFLVEAADDICYTIIDFEDGINLGLIPEDFALEYLGKLINQRIITEKYSRLATKEDRIAYLRAIAIGTLIEDASNTFMKYESAILNGDFHQSLLSESIYKPQIDDIIDISVSHIYRSPEVVEKEISGYAILQNLLDLFYTAIINDETGKTTSFDKLILNGLPEKYQKNGSIYERIMGITCYIASLTDGKALELHLKSLGRL
ncbi:Deoxyguanosinetriphosphate triphosphohydrolase-like protein [Capnocytophaga canimorsus]|uniref:Deoxyguanosinetriphosphate triphosphohydrolase-like protein n=1 Tax=Capnocytophaga canimorsus TaxID=28188 RepID=A0A0B7HAV4_9FLAO|nr:dNTP triphosphohydrolase [Capnocytophaga canimorsus]ATA77764.1 dGTPase [Capnocytophaga canimorsus]PJI76593.1 dGTPase [Capnocytophaga canimorsus]CEN36771.1 Deoxyguanosinetriphosphate triphosphohydrolase-like protein [Capnocytophaga canimorsus]STA73052.1 Deoxyguanosinetriphosphate triphosphohydrolase [Capnocytophaga canimorsus]